MSLASDGARQLLLAAARSHQVLYEQVWAAVTASEQPTDGLSFMVELLKLRPEAGLVLARL